MVIPSKAIQLITATLPAPENERMGAMVYGYDEDGKFIVLREGRNNLVCLADDPSKNDISVSCYAKNLEPFMQRGRELAAEGKSTKDKRQTRGEEVAQGKLKMPKEPSMTYIYYGSQEDYDIETGVLNNGQFRYVIYTPFATTETTGLPDKPHSKGMPWLMDPGTFRAHIMIGPF
ncbi:hypothetical protein ES765_06085 [Maribacter sp. ACAM166]|nr:hypothetical protein ES765_06085 [Maribacter sp. ACAM166]